MLSAQTSKPMAACAQDSYTDYLFLNLAIPRTFCAKLFFDPLIKQQHGKECI